MTCKISDAGKVVCLLISPLTFVRSLKDLIDILLDIFFAIDIILSFLTAYESQVIDSIKLDSLNMINLPNHIRCLICLFRASSSRTFA